MFGNGMQKPEQSLIIVCDEKDIAYANYLIQLIGQKDDTGESVVGVADDSVSAAIYTVKTYKDNLTQIPSLQHILFIGQTRVMKEQSKTIVEQFDDLGMHYGWLGKRAVLYIDNSANEWLKPKDDKKTYTKFLQFSEARGTHHPDALAKYEKKRNNVLINVIMPIVVNATAIVSTSKMLYDHNKTLCEIKDQQYRTLIKVFYEDGLRSFMEG